MKCVSRKIDSEKFRLKQHVLEDWYSNPPIHMTSYQTDGKIFHLNLQMDGRRYIIDLDRSEMLKLVEQLSSALEDTKDRKNK